MWDELNQSELVQLAKVVNPYVHRGISRDVLVELLEGTVELSLPPKGVDSARGDLYQVVDRYWAQVKSLVTCPLKTRNPRACFSCTDIQVAECSVLNQKLIERVKEEEDG